MPLILTEPRTEVKLGWAEVLDPLPTAYVALRTCNGMCLGNLPSTCPTNPCHVIAVGRPWQLRLGDCSDVATFHTADMAAALHESLMKPFYAMSLAAKRLVSRVRYRSGTDYFRATLSTQAHNTAPVSPLPMF